MSEADPQVRVRLDIVYDGSAFAGWARQPDQRTVQATIEAALATVLRLPVDAVALTVAGRTDAGVHASAQVAHVDVPAPFDARSTLRSLAGLLPPDVRVRALAVVSTDFDARFAALWRRYEYRLSDEPGGVDPLRRRVVLGWSRRLDVDAMQAAADGLVGLHDFTAFCRWREGATSIRTVHRLDVRRDAAEIVITVQADAFCYSMVRSVVGALLAVGEGRRPVQWPASLLDRISRADDVAVVPPHGLTLVDVGYPPDADLAARSAQTRARRT
jgi:tRNA pseudouridine38-40 synthase